MITFWLLFGLLAPLTISLIAFTYPAIQSIRSLEENQNQEKWLTYWVVYGVFNIVEFFSDILLSWFPLYFFIKTAFLIWCMAPIKLNGSIIIFKMIILPFFILHKEKLGKLLAYSSTLTYNHTLYNIRDRLLGFQKIKKFWNTHFSHTLKLVEHDGKNRFSKY